MADNEKYVTTIQNNELVLKVLEQSGTILPRAAGDNLKYVTCIVETADSKELALKVFNVGGGGGGGYTLPTATAERLGGVKIGSGLSVTEDGTVSVEGGGGGTSKRNVGEAVFSTVPLSDANLHELDGSLLTHSTDGDIVDVLGDIYKQSPTSSIFVQPMTEKEYFYDTVGNPTDNNGILTLGPGQKQYAQPTINFNPPVSNVWDIIVKYHANSYSNTPKILCGPYKGSETGYCFVVLINNTAHIEMLCSFNGTSWGLTPASTQTVDTTKDFYINFHSTGTAYKVDVSYDNETWEEFCSGDSTSPLANTGGKIVIGSNAYDPNSSSNIYGTVDMNASLIKYDGEVVWQGTVGPLTAEENFHHQVAINGYCDGYVYDSVNNTLRIPDLRKKASFPLGNMSKYVVIK